MTGGIYFFSLLLLGHCHWNFILFAFLFYHFFFFRRIYFFLPFFPLSFFVCLLKQPQLPGYSHLVHIFLLSTSHHTQQIIRYKGRIKKYRLATEITFYVQQKQRPLRARSCLFFQTHKEALKHTHAHHYRKLWKISVFSQSSRISPKPRAQLVFSRRTDCDRRKYRLYMTDRSWSKICLVRLTFLLEAPSMHQCPW